MVKTEHLQDAITREILDRSEWDRLSAVAQFPLEVFKIAYDLNQILRLHEIAGEPLIGESLEVALCMEREIAKHYRRRFGREMLWDA